MDDVFVIETNVLSQGWAISGGFAYANESFAQDVANSISKSGRIAARVTKLKLVK